MNKFSLLAASALVAVASHAFANNIDDDVRTLAVSAEKMSHDAIRARQATGVTADNADRFAALVKIDHTFLYGNHTSLAANTGIKVNAALGDHSALNDSVQSCRSALEENITTRERLTLVTSCQGKLQDLSNHNILEVDAQALEQQRRATAQLRHKLDI